MPNDIESFVSSAKGFLEAVRDKVLDSLLLSIDDLNAVNMPIINKVSAAINTALAKASTTLDAIVEDIKAGLDISISSFEAAKNGIVEAATSSINKAFLIAQLELQAVEDRIKDSITTETDDIVTTVTTIPGVEIPEIKVTVTQVPAEVEKTPVTVWTAIGEIPEAMHNISQALALFGKLGELGEVTHSHDDEIRAFKDVLKMEPGEGMTVAQKAIIASASGIGATVGSPLGLLPFLSDLYRAGLGEMLSHGARQVFHPSRMAVNDLALAYIRGNITDDKLFADALDMGYDEENVREYVRLTRQMLSAADLITLWLRGELSEVDLNERLHELAFTEKDSEQLKVLAHFIPGVQDLIRMAVREAFTPEIAEKFGQYEDYPPELTRWAKAQGLTEEWAKRYWASHWDLPSVQMGFEMLHRGVIDQETLEMLLRALDVMPYWRDKLTAISYSPFTRVDIRRMHKLKILDESEVLRAYMDIGYDEDKASKLTAFTLELNKEEVKLETASSRDLTASEVINAYANVFIDSTSASYLLSELGYDENEIELKLALAELPALKRIQNKQVEIIRQRLLYHAIDLNGAVDELNKLDLPPFELEYQLLDFQQDMELAELKAEAKSAK